MNRWEAKNKHFVLIMASLAVVLIAGVVTAYLLHLFFPRELTSDESAAHKNAIDNFDIGVAPTTRDALKQPFSSSSIWNIPIGSAARYEKAAILQTLNGETWAQTPYPDREHIILRPTAPMTHLLYSDAAWTGRDRCKPTSQTTVTTMPMPSDFVLGSDGGNGIVSSLMPDGRTIRQAQPLARCSTGSVATALVSFADVDIYGNGITGAHGGSNLSGIGGTLRVGELLKGGPPPRHVLKLSLYTKRTFFNCSVKQDCYRWPASTMDNYAIGTYGVENDQPNKSLVMGSLLAVPKNINIDSKGFETEPGLKLAWTLQNYGAYVVDDTFSPGVAISVEDGPDGSFVSQFESEFGIKFKQDKADDTAWVRDMKRILKLLEVVDNNSSQSPGGPGNRLQPLAPAITPSD